MRGIRAKESKVFGCLGFFGVSLVGIIAFLEFKSGDSFALASYLVGMVFFSWLAVIGLRAQAIYIDDKDVLVGTQPPRFRRVAMAEVVSVRTIPFAYSLDVLWIKSSSGRKSMTVVRRHDLRWLMSIMPEAAITTYWRRRN